MPTKSIFKSLAILLVILSMVACTASENTPSKYNENDKEQQPDSPANNEDKDPVDFPDWSNLSLTQQAQNHITMLQDLMADAQAKQLDTTREETTVWFAKEFLKYADWDEVNSDQVEKFFAAFYPYRNRGKEFADMLPDFERQQVINILRDSIIDLTLTIDGKINRPIVNKIDWQNIQVQQDQFVSNGKPVFLFDYFSKSMGNDTSNAQLYNDHLGNVDHLPSINLQWLANENKLASWQVDKVEAHSSSKVGYALFWNRSIPKWLRDKEPNITVGRSLFTEFDIDNPSAKNAWGKIARATADLTRDHKSTQMGIILSNEPHWYSEKGHWTQNYGEMTAISVHTQAKFKQWLQDQYEGKIANLNASWHTQFNRFDQVTFEFPIDPALRGKPLWYDWCRFNMDRATEWFSYLHNEIIDENADADTHIKIMPDVFTENNRSHGIDLEALTDLTTMIGDDAKTRGRDLRSNSPEHWESYYSYFWEELAVSYDFMESISPNKIHVNSETHFLSTSWWRDLGTSPEYVRSSIWLATVLGMDAGLHWFWARDPDGSPEQRLEGELNFYDPALAGSYAASAGMQPQVANEVAQVAMDLNSVSEQVMAIRQQRRPIRLFYSETSAINKNNHMTAQFELFESLFFTGFPAGYATENVIRSHDQSLWDMILVYKTEFVTDSEFSALQSYLDNGGTVIIDSVTSLAKNEYGQPRQSTLTAGVGTLITMTNSNAPNEMVKTAIDNLSTPMPLQLIENNGLSKATTMWRYVTQEDGSIIATLLNLGKNQSEITLKHESFNSLSVVDQLTGQELTDRFSIEPNAAVMLEIKAQ